MVQARLDGAEIAEEQPFVDTDEERTGDRFDVMTDDIAEMLSAGNPADDCDMWGARTQQQGRRRQQDTHPDTNFQPEDQHAAGSPK